MSPEDHDRGVIEHNDGWYYINVPSVTPQQIAWCTENCEYEDWLQLGRVFYFKHRDALTAFRLTWLA